MREEGEGLRRSTAAPEGEERFSATFDESYFLEGPYERAVFSGWRRYLGQYYWARRFYANLVRRYKSEGALLEIGCGFGDLLAFLEADFETYGIDISEAAIEVAERRASRSRLEVLAAENVDKLDMRFDVIIACHVLEHVESPGTVIRKVADLLRYDGILLLAVPNTTSIGKTLKGERWVGLRDETHISLLAPRAWLDLLEVCHLSPRRVFSDGLWDTPYVPVIPTFIQKAIFGLPAMVQVLLARPFLPLRLGESLVVIAAKS